MRDGIPATGAQYSISLYICCHYFQRIIFVDFDICNRNLPEKNLFEVVLANISIYNIGYCDPKREICKSIIRNLTV